jgi:uncharacterized protein with HEPN domain
MPCARHRNHIGSGAANPPELQAMQPTIPWAQIMGIGNILRHEYHRVSDTAIWNVVVHHLPPLRTAIATIDSELRED